MYGAREGCRGRWAAMMVLVAVAACGTTEPEPIQPDPDAISRITIPPIQNYFFSAVVNPGCQDTGYGINDQGTIIGIACGEAFRRLSDGTMIELPSLGSQGANGTAVPLDINGNNRIVGYSVETGGNSMRPVQWFFLEGSMAVSDLGVFAGGSRGQAHGVNASADIVGWAEILMAGGLGVRKHGFLRRTSGLRIDLVPGNGYRDAEAYDVNDQGYVVGVSYSPITTGSLTRRATMWVPAGQGSNTYSPILLPTLYRSEARAINSGGDIAGWHSSTATGGNIYLTKWKVGTSNFTTISPSDVSTVPQDINDDGIIVGERQVSTGSTPVAFAYGTKFATMPVPLTSSRSFAMGVNSCGNLVGEAHQNQSGNNTQVAALWTRTGC
jgi:uncharacterized membrane protein